MPGVGHEVPVNRDGLPGVLVGPAGVVAVGLHAEPHVRQEGHHVRLAVVQRLQGGEVVLRSCYQSQSQPVKIMFYSRHLSR